MRAGDTFVFHDGSDNHLWVVISNPELDVTAFVVIVNLTTYKVGKDSACILNPEDHPFIKHETCVQYADARAVSNVILDRLADTVTIVLQGPVTPEVLDRIRRGAAESRFIPEGCRKVLVEQGLIE